MSLMFGDGDESREIDDGSQMFGCREDSEDARVTDDVPPGRLGTVSFDEDLGAQPKPQKQESG
jgi:hypothetical protein